jgi:hypothetical protein
MNRLRIAFFFKLQFESVENLLFQIVGMVVLF